MLTVGKKLGPFEIEKELGAGAMRAFYRPRNRVTCCRPAITVTFCGRRTKQTAIARIERELDVLKQLKHRNIVRLKTSRSYRTAPSYVMEYVEGEPLESLLR